MPAANSIFSQSFSGNYPLVLAKKMQFETIKHMMWGKWARYTTPGGAYVQKGNVPNPVSSPVAVQNELSGRAGDLIEIPMHRNLKNFWRIGKEQMKEHEEEPKVNFLQVPVELLRHAEKPQESSIDTQVNKDLRLLQNCKPALQRHYAQGMNYWMCSWAMYNGYSLNVLASSRWSGHAKIAAVQHPHIFTAGRGKVSYSTYGYPGNAAYNQGVATEMGFVGAGDVFDTGFLNGLKADPAIQKIAPIITKDGNEFRIIVAHPWQIKDLVADATFREIVAASQAQAYAKDNPYLVGCKYFWEGFAIFSSDTMIFPVRVDSSVPQWGPSTMQVAAQTGDIVSHEDYTSDTMFGAIVLGANALFIANADRLGFRKRTDDFGELNAVAYRHITGSARADFWNRDDGTTGQYVVNESSAICITYGAAPGF